MKIIKNARKSNSLISGTVAFHKDSCCGSRA